MAKINPGDELQEAILVLESKQKEDLKQLRKEFEDVIERLKPKNMLKAGVSNLRHSPKLRTALIAGGVGLLSIFALKKITSRRKRKYNKRIHYNNPATSQVKKVSGSVAKYIIAAIISQNSNKIKDVALGLLNRMKTPSAPKRPKRNDENLNEVVV